MPTIICNLTSATEAMAKARELAQDSRYSVVTIEVEYDGRDRFYYHVTAKSTRA